MGRIEELLDTVLRYPAETDDLQATLGAYAEIRDTATTDDLPLLLETVRSDRSDFVAREMLAEPIATLGGPAVLPDLLRAFQANRDEGHDNDTFSLHLIELVEAYPSDSAAELRPLLASANPELRADAEWLLEFCNPGG